MAGLALAIGAYALWDYAEARRVLSTIAAVSRAGGSINLDQIERRPPTGSYDNAAPYYAAAATLAGAARPLATVSLGKNGAFSGVPAPGGLQTWYATGAIPAAMLEPLHVELERSADALRLLDLATARPFEGFAGGPAYWQVWEFEYLCRLCSARTTYAAATGDKTLALQSLRAELALFGDRSRPVVRTPTPKLLLSALNLSLVLNTHALTTGDLDALSQAFARADDDDLLWRTLDSMRAGYITTFLRRAAYARLPFGIPRFIDGVSGEGSLVLRPLSAQHLLRRLAIYDELTAASRLPWTERLDQMRAVALRRQWRDDAGFLVNHGWSQDPWGFTSEPLGLSSVRVARAAIAIERYRLANRGELPATLGGLVPAYLAAIPIDPYSGQPIHYARLADGYQVYSVSFDRKDDGGDLLKDQPVIRVRR